MAHNTTEYIISHRCHDGELVPLFLVPPFTVSFNVNVLATDPLCSPLADILKQLPYTTYFTVNRFASTSHLRFWPSSTSISVRLTELDAVDIAIRLGDMHLVKMDTQTIDVTGRIVYKFNKDDGGLCLTDETANVSV